MKYLIYGGSASGKSEFAENLICELSHFQENLIYFATLDKNSGGDTKSRIEKHKKMRFQKKFSTIELSDSDLESIFHQNYDFLNDYNFENSSILLEDLGNLVARIVFFKNSFSDFQTDFSKFTKIIEAFLEKLESLSKNFVIVSNDIFLEKIDLSDSGMRAYFQTLAKLNQRIAKKSKKNYRIVAGISISD